jgi:hypothetical protein
MRATRPIRRLSASDRPSTRPGRPPSRRTGPFHATGGAAFERAPRQGGIRSGPGRIAPYKLRLALPVNFVAHPRSSAMPTLLPPPRDWQAFEDLCGDLWRELWRDPEAQKHV